MTRHRILALVTDAFGGFGGIAQYNRDLLKALAALPGVDAVHVLPRLAPDDPEPLHSSIHQHEAIFSRPMYSAAALWLAIRTRPTIVFNGHILHGPLSSAVASGVGARLISQLHGTEVWGDIKNRHRRPLEDSDLVLAVSRDTRAKLLSKADVEPERAVVLNNTVGQEFTPGDRKIARTKYGLTQEFAILTVARLDAPDGYKGHDRIIPTVAKLRSDGLNVCYLIAGVGEDRARLEGLARNHGLEGIVRFLGKVSSADLPDLYRAADLFALPSAGEGFGIVFLEAMACGTPAIGLCVGGAPDALGDGELGLCVSEAGFNEALEGALRVQRPPDADRAAAIQRRFGLSTFRARVAEVMGLLA